MTEAAPPLLGPPSSGGRRPRNPWALALHLYCNDAVWRGAVDIVWIGSAVVLLTFGMPDLLQHGAAQPAPPAAVATAPGVPAAAPAATPPSRGARTMTDYERYELDHLLVWSASDPARVAYLKDTWRAALERQGQAARDRVEADAHAGDADAQFLMAIVMLTASGLPQRFTDAEPWLQKAADQGQPMALFWVGENGLQGRGAHPVDKTTGMDLLHRAEGLGYSEAGDKLCMAYAEGNGVKADPAEAVAQCRRGAELGNPRAMNRLGYFYVSGTGIARDPNEAFKWLSKAAESGLPEAERNLGMAYLNGLGTPRDPAKAIEWTARSADHGYVDAYVSLGTIYRDGQTGAVDLPKAATWFRKAALKGSPKGQYFYAMALEQGRGVNPDKVEAYIYYNLAALQGHGAAEAGLSRLKAQLAADELQRATRMAEAMRTRKAIE